MDTIEQIKQQISENPIILYMKGSPKLPNCGFSAQASQAVMSCGRHISSTTITTVGGFLPLILAGGGFWPPFAVAVAGGTVLTTLLSFYFVPAAFSLFSNHKAFEPTEVEAIAHSN